MSRVAKVQRAQSSMKSLTLAWLCMHQGYSSCFACVYLSATTLTATYLANTSKTRCHGQGILYGIFQIFNVSLLLKMLCSVVLVLFADITAAFLIP